MPHLPPRVVRSATLSPTSRLDFCVGDVRQLSADAIVFGRSARLRAHFESDAKGGFAPLGVAAGFPKCDVALLQNGPPFAVVSAWYNPPDPSRNEEDVERNCLSIFLEQLLVAVVDRFSPTHLALVPFTWRFPDRQAWATINAVRRLFAFWSGTITAGLPRRFSVIALHDISPYEEAVAAVEGEILDTARSRRDPLA